MNRKLVKYLELVQVFQSSDEIALEIQDSQMLALVSKELNLFNVQLMQGHLLQGSENAVVVFSSLHKTVAKLLVNVSTAWRA